MGVSLRLRYDADMLAAAVLAAFAGRLHVAPCTVGKAALPAVCGRYTVYEDRAARSGRTIDLKFVVIKAKHETNRAIAFNPGGPGASAVDDAPLIADGGFARELLALRDNYDLLFLDNRGTGGSAPQQCDFAPADRPQLYFLQIWPDELVRACRERLARGADLSLYTSSIAADDLDDLRAALGYSKLVLDGGSYGTQFYLVYARRHPERVESMVLDGVAPPGLLVVPLEDARGAQDSMTQLIAECRADVVCRRDFRAFGSHFYAVVRRFDAGTVVVPLRNTNLRQAGAKRVVKNLRLSKEVFADRLRQMLYYPGSARYVPYIIERAFRGDYTPLAAMVNTVTQGFAGILATGLNLSVTCAEDVPFITEGDIARTSANSFEGDVRVRAQQRACRIWNVRPVAASFNDPVRSDAPILMVSGTDDPTSPPQFAQAALPFLPNARILLIRNGSHGTETDCGDRLKVAFVRAGSGKALNLTQCQTDYRRPPFATSLAGF
jgi:pimeloyl-ACP methyl ester carboxylesterase